MASRTSTDPLEILLEMGVDLDDLSEQDYLSALMEAIATIEFQTKGKGDARSVALRKEVVKERKRRRENPDPDVFFGNKPDYIQERRKKISVAAFKRGSATGTSVAPKALPSSAIVPYQKPEAEEKKEEKKKGSPKNLILEISETVTRIADILKDQYDLKKDTATFDRKKAERERRDLQKKNLAKRFEGLKRVAEKIIEPVKGVFDRIMGFLFNIILGKFLIKLVEWFSNPDNQSKVKSIIRFLTDNWPKLLSAYIIFGTGLGKFSRFLVKILARGAVRLAAATTGLLARLFGARALGKFSRFFGRRGKVIAGGIEAVTTIIAFKALENAFTKGIAPEESASIDNDIPVSGYQGGGLVQPIFKFGGGGSVKFNLFDPRSWFSGRAQQAVDSKGTGTYSDDTLGGRLLNRRNATNEAIRQMRGYEEGGEVDGPSGIDKVPAMLTDGEFVMSRGAVQKYGLAQLEAMNAAGGGTNQPKIMNGTVFANTGGPIGGGPMFPEHPSDYRTGSLVTDPLGALDRILGQSFGIRLPGGGSKSSDTPPPRAQPKDPVIPSSTTQPEPKQETSADQTAGSIPERMLKSPTFRDSGLLYLRSMLGGFGGPITENQLSQESRDELNKAIARAKKRTAGELRTAEQDLARAKAGNYSNIAEIQSRYDRLKRGEVRVLYQDYYEGGKITPAAEDAKSILGKFWAATTENGGYRVVNERYDFVDMKDPLAVLMGDSSGVSKKAKAGEPITLRQKLQALHQLNPFARDMAVDMILGEKPNPQRDIGNMIKYNMGGLADFFTGNAFDFDRQGGRTLMNPSGKSQEKLPSAAQPKAQPQPQPKAQPKLTAAQIKNNQAYAASKGKYYSSTTGKTYANYTEALKDPAVAAGAKKMQQKSQSTMNMIMGGKDAYYSSTTGQYYKNYAEALKDPKVAAAAEVEKVKKQYSFTPSTNQQPNLTIPGMPTNASGSNITVIKAPSQSTGPNLGGGGSEVPSRPPGSGDPAKFRILGLAGLAAG